MNQEYTYQGFLLILSMKKGDHMHRRNMYFHNTGLWHENTTNKNKWQMKSLSSIITMLGHKKVRLVRENHVVQW